jgi:hypothetical protein
MPLIPAWIKAVLTKPSQSMAERSRVPVIFLGIPAENSRQFALNIAQRTYGAPAQFPSVVPGSRAPVKTPAVAVHTATTNRGAPALCVVAALGVVVHEIGASAP